MITAEQLHPLLAEIPPHLRTALIVRTLPNGEEKLSAHYGNQQLPPFFTQSAIALMKEEGVAHLLVDLPSLDKMHDEGHMTNHHTFWGVDPKTNRAALTPEATPYLNHTISELLYIPNDIIDGHYLLEIQLPAWQCDAVPSRPILYPMERINR